MFCSKQLKSIKYICRMHSYSDLNYHCDEGVEYIDYLNKQTSRLPSITNTAMIICEICFTLSNLP